MRRECFTFTVWYFKPSGKLYTEATVNWEIQSCDVEPGAPRQPYMADACDKLRNLLNEAKAPGLQSGTWDGLVLLNCEEGFPCLILPRE